MATRPKQADRSQTAAQRRLPEWLPPSIVDYTHAIMAGRLDADLKHDVLLQTIREAMRERPELRVRLNRLTGDSRMNLVWRWLEQEMQKIVASAKVPVGKITAMVGACLRGYLYRAMIADHRAAYWNSSPRAHEQRETMLRISTLARELIKLLNSPLNPYEFTPWDSLDAAVDFAQNAPALDQKLFDELARKTYGHFWQRGKSASGMHPRKVQADVPSYVFRLPARALLGHLPSQLSGLVMLADLSVASDSGMHSKPPSKTEHLRHTVYIRDLARYVKSLGLRARPPNHRQAGFPLHQIIAITTNVALRLSGGDECRSDTVRKLIAENR